MNQRDRDERVTRPGRVHDLDLEGRHAALERLGNVVLRPALAHAHQDQGDAAVEQGLGGLPRLFRAEEWTQFLAAQLHDVGAVEERLDRLARGLDALPEVLPEVTSKATGTSSSPASLAASWIAERTGSFMSGMLPKFTNKAPESNSGGTSSAPRSSSAAGDDR